MSRRSSVLGPPGAGPPSGPRRPLAAIGRHRPSWARAGSEPGGPPSVRPSDSSSAATNPPRVWGSASTATATPSLPGCVHGDGTDRPRRRAGRHPRPAAATKLVTDDAEVKVITSAPAPTARSLLAPSGTGTVRYASTTSTLPPPVPQPLGKDLSCDLGACQQDPASADGWLRAWPPADPSATKRSGTRSTCR